MTKDGARALFESNEPVPEGVLYMAAAGAYGAVSSDRLNLKAASFYRAKFSGFLLGLKVGMERAAKLCDSLTLRLGEAVIKQQGEDRLYLEGIERGTEKCADAIRNDIPKD